MQLQTVRVSLAERSYDIQIGKDLLQNCGSLLLAQVKTSHAVVIADSNTAPHAATVVKSLQVAGVRVDLLPGHERIAVDGHHAGADEVHTGMPVGCGDEAVDDRILSRGRRTWHECQP